MQAAALVADEAAEKPTSSSEAPASSPGTLPADDTPMGDTSSETASPNRETTPVLPAAPAALAQEEPSHDDDDDVAGEADTPTPDAAVRRSERVKDAPERVRFTYTPAEVGAMHSYNRKDEDEQYLSPTYAREFDAGHYSQQQSGNERLLPQERSHR